MEKEMKEIKREAERIVAGMSLEEKAAIVSGADFWRSKSFERLGLKGMMLTDGPHGLRKQAGASDHLGINDSVPAVCFPPACLSACSWDRELLNEMGEALGEKCVREDVAVLLGPGVNIKRSPLCGRNFEYFSEDPYLSGELGTAYVNGVQSRGVGTSLKHFAANSQESSRMIGNSEVDERTLREIYLTAFEKIVKNAQPWTVMCSYNKINGVYASENEWLLNRVLRNEWGFNGVVVSDWGASNNRVKGIKAGMDLEMPYSGEANAKRLVNAVGVNLTEAELDLTVTRIVELYLKAQQNKNKKSFERTDETDHELAVKIAEASMVLLKNEGVLPLKKSEKVAFIGRMAKEPRYQGAGSSKINPFALDNAFDEAVKLGVSPFYAEGYGNGNSPVSASMIEEACKVAGAADKVVVFAGLPDEYESEGFDRTSIAMPDSHLALIDAICNVSDNVTVVLQCGSVVALPFKDKAGAILLSYLGGEGGGRATADILFGRVNPSGKLAETWPEKLSDTSSYENFPGSFRATHYCEGLYVGYRYFDTVDAPVNYPFGYGLSYTSFEYSDISLIRDSDTNVTVSLNVRNTGSVEGSETVQLYIRKSSGRVYRPVHELKAFTKIKLIPGEKKEVVFKLNAEAFRYFDREKGDYACEQGEYSVEIGACSRDIRLVTTVTIEGDTKALCESSNADSYFKPAFPPNFTKEAFEELLGRKCDPGDIQRKGEFDASSSLTDIKKTLIGKVIIGSARKSISQMAKDNADEGTRKMGEAMLMSMPLRAMTMAGSMTLDQADGIAELANGHVLKGLRLLGKK